MSDSTDVLDAQYLGGLLDAQLGVCIRKDALRVTLSNEDDRILKYVTEKFQPTRETIIKTRKKDDTMRIACCLIYQGDHARDILGFCVDNCVTKKGLARAGLDYLDGKTTATDVDDVSNDITIPDSVPKEWVSGFFDAKGQTHLGAKRASVKLVVPKGQHELLEAIQKTAGGKVRKKSPCRLVFDSKQAINTFLENCGTHIRVKRPEITDLRRKMSV